MHDIVMTVSDFVAVFNQTIECAYPSVSIEGEISNFRVSKNKWVFFDLKDEFASVKFFGIVFQMPGPLEDGMMVEVKGTPRLHHQLGFSVMVQNLRPVGEGSIKKAASLLEVQLSKEGLFAPERKRLILRPPQRVGLITSGDSAAYNDFIKILSTRWGGIEVFVADVQVQGEVAATQIVRAIDYFNTHQQVDVLVITRGGGSVDDLAVFNSEQVTRAVAGSRNSTIVAIGHEVDVSLAELAADLRASTPSNAAELLVPDRKDILKSLYVARQQMYSLASNSLRFFATDIKLRGNNLDSCWTSLTDLLRDSYVRKRQLLKALSPETTLNRGYAVIRSNTELVRSIRQLQAGSMVTIQLNDGTVEGKINIIKVQ